MAIGGSRQQIFNVEAFSSSKIYCFDRTENIATYQVSLMIKKNTFIESTINKLARELTESGLFVKWNRDNSKKSRILEESEIEGISLKHFGSPLLLIYCVGLLTAFISFLWETITFSMMRKSNKVRIWKYLNAYFDGRRHVLKNLPEKIQGHSKF